MSEESKGTIADRLAGTGLATDRFIDVQNGSKKSVDHEQHDAVALADNCGIYANGNDALYILDSDEYDDLDDKSGISALHTLPPTLEQGSPYDSPPSQRSRTHRGWLPPDRVPRLRDGSEIAGVGWAAVRT